MIEASHRHSQRLGGEISVPEGKDQDVIASIAKMRSTFNCNEPIQILFSLRTALGDTSRVSSALVPPCADARKSNRGVRTMKRDLAHHVKVDFRGSEYIDIGDQGLWAHLMLPISTSIKTN